MNYLPYISWGAYGATTTTERAIYFASWGILGTAGAAAAAISIYLMAKLGGGAAYLKRLGSTGDVVYIIDI